MRLASSCHTNHLWIHGCIGRGCKGIGRERLAATVGLRLTSSWEIACRDISGANSRICLDDMCMLRDLSLEQSDILLTSHLSYSVAGTRGARPSAYRYSSAQVWQGKGGASISAIGSAQDTEESSILGY